MTPPNPPITVTDLSAERPILGRSDDLLDRSAFADHIANAIRGWTGQDSLVISLDGGWGTGKSSLKNLILESLHSEAEISPRILEFNPWQWAGQGQLAQAFFREIGKLIGRHDVAEESKLKAIRWSRYSAALGLGGQIFAATRRLALVGLSIVGLLSFAGGFFVLGAWKIALSTIAALAFLGVALMESGGQIVQAVANYFHKTTEAQEKTLVETKNELSDALRSLTKPILVVVDDIDRLSGQEILLLF